MKRKEALLSFLPYRGICILDRDVSTLYRNHKIDMEEILFWMLHSSVQRPIALREEDLIEFWKLLIRPIDKHLQEKCIINTSKYGTMIMMDDSTLIWEIYSRIKSMPDREAVNFFNYLKNKPERTYSISYMKNIQSCVCDFAGIFDYCRFRHRTILIAYLNDSYCFDQAV